MTADNRSVATDALATLGTVIDDRAGRDAIHIAVEPVVAAVKLYAGQDVKLAGDRAVPATKADGLGIVDPFLDQAVLPGDRFWLLIYPRTITALRHVWEHPAFEVPAAPALRLDPVSVSRGWIEEFAASIPLAYDTLMEGARNYLADKRSGGYGEYLCFGGLLEGESVPDEFWPHYEVVTGETVAESERGSFFTCSC